MIETNAKEFEKELIDLYNAFYPEGEGRRVYHEQMLAASIFNIIKIKHMSLSSKCRRAAHLGRRV